jgi:hypothetical protein
MELDIRVRYKLRNKMRCLPRFIEQVQELYENAKESDEEKNNEILTFLIDKNDQN